MSEKKLVPLSEIDFESLLDIKVNIFTLRDTIERGVKLNIIPMDIPSMGKDDLQKKYDALVVEQTDNIMTIIINELYMKP